MRPQGKFPPLSIFEKAGIGGATPEEIFLPSSLFLRKQGVGVQPPRKFFSSLALLEKAGLGGATPEEKFPPLTALQVETRGEESGVLGGQPPRKNFLLSPLLKRI